MNKSGYCHEHYRLSAQYAWYQRKKQLEYYHKGRYKNWLKKYNKLPHVLEKKRIYGRKYAKEHREELSAYKHEWDRKNKHRRKKYRLRMKQWKLKEKG